MASGKQQDIRKNIRCSAPDLNPGSPIREVFYLLRCKVQLFTSSLLKSTKFTPNGMCNCPAVLSSDSFLLHY